MTNLLTPVLALVVWTLIIWAIMYSRLIPHLRKKDVEPQTTRSPEGEWREALPEPVQYGMHNYNHLMEQPTIFYALMFYLHLAGMTAGWIVVLAWVYVICRIIHSLVQISSNKVMVRFTVFFVSTLALIAMSIGGIMGLL